jgi:hypothetical protein
MNGNGRSGSRATIHDGIDSALTRANPIRLSNPTAVASSVTIVDGVAASSALSTS